MSRKLRAYSKSKIYHIILKGIDNQDIFYDEQDRRVFLKQITDTKKEYDYRIYAYCLMVNHVHLVIKIENEFLSKAIQSLMIRYVHYFNKKYERVGTLVQNRFKSKNVENLRYFIEVCRYVHRNPESAGIERTEDYKWSSYNEYIEKEEIVDKKVLLCYFNNDIKEFKKYTTKKEDVEEIENFAEYEIIERLTDEQFANIIMKKFKLQHISEIPNFFKIKNREELEKDLEQIKCIKGTNKAQVARVIRLTRRTIGRVWEQKRTGPARARTGTKCT